MVFQLSFSWLTGLLQILHPDKQLRKPWGSLTHSRCLWWVLLFERVQASTWFYIYDNTPLCFLLHALPNCKTFADIGFIAAFPTVFYAPIILGMLSLDSCELHSLQKPLVEASHSSHLALVVGDFVRGGISNHLTPALSSATGFWVALGKSLCNLVPQFPLLPDGKSSTEPVVWNTLGDFDEHSNQKWKMNSLLLLLIHLLGLLPFLACTSLPHALLLQGLPSCCRDPHAPQHASTPPVLQQSFLQLSFFRSLVEHTTFIFLPLEIPPFSISWIYFFFPNLGSLVCSLLPHRRPPQRSGHCQLLLRSSKPSSTKELTGPTAHQVSV